MAANDVFGVVQRRRSIRKFTPQPITADQLEQILAVATGAPSAGNLQAYHIVVVKNAIARQRLSRAAGSKSRSKAGIMGGLGKALYCLPSKVQSS